MKKRYSKQALSLALAVIMALSTLIPCLCAFASTGECGAEGSNISWRLSNGTLTISGSGKMMNYNPLLRGDDYIMPEWNRSTIERIVIEEGVESIGNYAFYCCSRLVSVSIPDSVKSIGDHSFYHCGITQISIPSTVEEIRESAFEKCTELNKVTISSGVKKIYNMAFHYCTSLNKIKVPDSVTYIGQAAFKDCSALISVTLPKGLKAINAGLFSRCSSLVGISLPSSVKIIDFKAFDECISLASIKLPSGLEYIGARAFNNCSSLKNIALPKSIKTVREKAIGYNGSKKLKGVKVTGKIPDKSKTAKSYQTKSGECGCYGENVKWRLKDNALTISGSGSLTGWGYRDYSPWRGDSSIERVVIEEGITEIASFCFRDCTSLKEIVIPSSVTRINGYALKGCTSLKSFSVPSQIASVSTGVFMDCTSLKSVKLPKSIKKLEAYLFQGCTAMESFTVHEGVKTIEFDVFKDCSSLKSVKLPSTLKRIYFEAFQNCSSLSKITLPAGVDAVEGSTFNGCTSLSEVKISAKPAVVSNYAFKGCKALKTINLDNVNSVGNYAFKGCSSLKRVVLGDELSYVGEQAFMGCALKEIYLPSTLRLVSNAAESDDKNFLESKAFGYKDSKTRIKGFKVYGRLYTVAEDYARTNGFKFLDSAELENAEIAGLKNATYGKSNNEPSFSLEVAGKALKKGRDYTVSYKNNSKVGRATLKIKGKGDYQGTIEASFRVNPEAAEVKSISAASKGFTLKWKKQPVQTTGYELQYSTSSSFKNAGAITVKGKDKTSKTVKGLKAGKKYYVRLRTYKTVNKVKYYSSWSKAQTVTIKK